MTKTIVEKDGALSEARGRIAGIKRFEIHDGDGIRTTLFLKGCPLKCRWCHNPETISPKPQVAYFKDKCTACGECALSCPAGAHTVWGGGHAFDRRKCTGCGRCEEACPAGALTFYGREISAGEALKILLEDRIFYEKSGGGVTLSGGEPLMQADFCMALQKLLKGEGIHVAVDTCGFAQKEDIDKIIDYTDIFLYDIKFFDSVKHRQYTGRTNETVLENLKHVISRGKLVEIRIPFIPGINDDQIEPIGRSLAGLKNRDRITKIVIVPYHDYATNKYAALEMEYEAAGIKIPDGSRLAEAAGMLESFGFCAAISGNL